MTWRNLKRVPRIPELAIFASLQSIMFVLLFAYVFGGAIPLPGGGSYREYLMPGIYIQTLGFASVTTAIAVTDDMAKGADRPLPLAAGGAFGGAERPHRLRRDLQHGHPPGADAHRTGRRLARAHELRRLPSRSRTDALLHIRDGLDRRSRRPARAVRRGRTAARLPDHVSAHSNAFVPTSTLPGWLRPVAEWNPFSALTAATRELFGNPNPFTSGYPGDHPFLLSILWTFALLTVFAPLAVRKYRSIDR